jgi:hypothetical protein
MGLHGEDAGVLDVGVSNDFGGDRGGDFIGIARRPLPRPRSPRRPEDVLGS